VMCFSALTLLVGQQEEQLMHEKIEWWGAEAKCKWFASGPADVTATPPSLAPLKSRMAQPFWYRFTQVVQKKRVLNGCSSKMTYRMVTQKKVFDWMSENFG